MADIFVSYDRADRQRARELVETLEKRGWSVFWDSAIRVGVRYEDLIEEEIYKCRVMVVMWSPRSVASEWVRDEASFGLKLRKLMPVLIEPTRIPFKYDGLQTADLIKWRPGSETPVFQHFTQSIAESLDRRLGPAPSPWSETAPSGDTCRRESSSGLARASLDNPSMIEVFHPERIVGYTHFENGALFPFDIYARSFCGVNAWWLAESALLSYWPPGDAIERFRQAGFDDCEFIDSWATQYYLSTIRDDAVIVAFRGTQSEEERDIVDDLSAARVVWTSHSGHVHSGMAKAVRSAWPSIKNRFKRAAVRRAWFTGHGFGGALAILAADLMAQDELHCDIFTYTYGSPRIGDAEFATAFNSRHLGQCFRYVTARDLVPRVPPPTFGYRHVGEELTFDEHGKISPPNAANIRFIQDSLPDSAVVAASMPPFLTDHMPRQYAILVWNALVDAIE
jgi:hypothetical protein